MIRDSIRAFIDEDNELAITVCVRDATVDELHEAIVKELIEQMRDEPQIIERALHIIRISRNLERVADLATNIAEDTIYMISGKVIKHQTAEES